MLDNRTGRWQRLRMNSVRHVLDLDPLTDTRLRELAAERGLEASAVIAEAISLLDSVVNVGGPDLEEDRRRLREFERTREAITGPDMMAWVESWDSPNELPSPQPRKIG
jgi:predicted transcriptional regulator